MEPDQPPADAAPDPATLCRLARLAGLELAPERAARLLVDLRGLIKADRRLAALDLGHPTTNPDDDG